jgi:RluA family pseudouridine synthase
VTNVAKPLHSDIESINESLNTKYWCWQIIDPSENVPRHLIDLLKEKLPQIDPPSWGSRLDFGGVYINGLLATKDQPLPYPCRVEYYEPKFDISDAEKIFPVFRDDYILYQDDHIIGVYKPPGISSAPAKEQRHYSLKASLERLLGARIHMPSRLDFSASGVVVVSKIGEASRGLQNAFANRFVDKRYLCASGADCAWEELKVELPIGRDPYHPVLRMIDPQSGQKALTSFKKIARIKNREPYDPPLTIISAKPVTGRTHQIRVHAAASGAPLAGDRFYRGIQANLLHLVSTSIDLTHPVTQKEISISLPERLKPWWTKVDP